ncbi:MAG: tetratricopeptide repeat protein [Pseudomonadota bacterium]
MKDDRAPRAWILCLGLSVLVVAAYAPALGGPFLWDDHVLILDSPLVRGQTSLRAFFASAFWEVNVTEPLARGYYRPLTLLSFALDHALHGTNSAGFHLTNVLLHATNAVLLGVLLTRIGMAPVAGTLAALLWALVPRLTEAVAWISGRTDVLATTFVLAALLVALPRTNAPRRWLAALLVLFGLFAKEVAAAGLCALAALELSRAEARPGPRFRALLPCLAAAFVYAGFRIAAIGVQHAHIDVTLADRLPAGLEALGRYALSLLTPWLTDVQAGRLVAPNLGYAALGGAVLLAAAALLVAKRRSLARPSEPVLVGATLGLVSLALVLHVVPIAVNVTSSDRFLYLPLTGLTLAAAPKLAALLARRSLGLRLVVVLTLLGSFAVATTAHAARWSDEVEFWLATYKRDRDRNGIAVNELGNVYFRAGLHAHAAAIYASFQDVDIANLAGAQSNLALSLQCLGRYAEARTLRLKAVERRPDVARYRFDLALSELDAGNFAEAERQLAEALRLYPRFELARKVRSWIPELRARAARTEPQGTAEDPMAAFHHAAKRARMRDAVAALVRAAKAGRLDGKDADEALHFALRYADPTSTAIVYRAYRAALGGEPPAGIAEAVRQREEAATRLLDRWPELGLSLTLPPLPH